jgi:APA family basic amino acid/polyamine antiporter
MAFVAGATNFAVYVAFIAICVSLVVLRFARPDARRPFRAPLAIGRLPLLPVAGIGLVILQIAHLEGEVLLLGTGLFISGLIAMEVLSLWRPD